MAIIGAMIKTEREFSNPQIRQLGLFLDNRVGRLRDVLRFLSAEDVLVHALSIIDGADHAIVRLVVDRPDSAHKALVDAQFSIVETEVLVVEIPDDRTGLVMICRSLLRGEINIHYAYPMLTRPHGIGALVVHVDILQTAGDLLEEDGFKLLDSSDLGLAGI
ncbi:MAG TPA: acetolactate synthase [Planctomycetes bacterium]|nr:acetolactate synthase [Planctomycetota bacterium]